MNQDLINVIAELDVHAEILENNAQVAMNEGRGDDVARLHQEALATRQAITILGGN